MHNVKSTVLTDQSAVFASVTFTICLLNVNIPFFFFFDYLMQERGFPRSSGKDNTRRSALRRCVLIIVINV